MKKQLISLFLFIAIGLGMQAQQSETHVHDRYCRHYPELNEVPAYAFRNDWQSTFLHDYDVSFYWLDIEVSSTSTDISGKVTVVGDILVDFFEVFAFELVPDFQIDSIIFNGTKIENFHWEGDNVLADVSEMAAGGSFTAEIHYWGTPPTGGGFFSGVSNDFSNTWQKSVTWTLSQPFNAKHWFPVKQVLTDKADSVWVYLTTSADEMAASQGLLTQVTTLDNGKKRYEWKSNYPIAYYLISFAVSDYQEYNIYAKPQHLGGDSVLIQNFIYNHPNYLDTYKDDIDVTIPMLEMFSDLYSLYPFHEEKYGHAITKMGGGMEHQTMSTMGYWFFNLVAHELGHMWFGDNVTCATWSDIWINEGFATYSSYLAFHVLQGAEQGTQFMVSAQNNVMSQPGGSTYIPPDQISPDNLWRIFNGRLSYDKGAAIIHVLRNEINNDELFFGVLQTFQQEFRDSTATGDDFRMVAEQVTGMAFEQFFAQWYYGEGYPIYDIEYYIQEENVYMNVSQSTSTSVTPLFEMTMEYMLVFEDGSDTLVRLFQDANLNQFIIPVSQPVAQIIVDPNNHTFEKVNSINVGIDRHQNDQYFTFYPNPVHSEVNIHLLQDISGMRKLQIIDAKGQIRVEKAFAGRNLTVDVSGLPNGMYVLQLSDEYGTFARKMIK